MRTSSRWLPLPSGLVLELWLESYLQWALPMPMVVHLRLHAPGFVLDERVSLETLQQSSGEVVGYAVRSLALRALVRQLDDAKTGDAALALSRDAIARAGREWEA